MCIRDRTEAQERLGLNIGEHDPTVTHSMLYGALEKTQGGSVSNLSDNAKKVSKPKRIFGVGSEIGLALSEMSTENRSLLETQQHTMEIISAAAESLTDGMLIYDVDSKVMVANSSYKELMSQRGVNCEVGMDRRDIVQQLVEIGELDLQGDTVDDYLEPVSYTHLTLPTILLV